MLRNLLRYWHRLWADFDDEFSFSLKRDRVKASIETTPWRFAVYAAVVVGISVGLSFCDGAPSVNGTYLGPP